MTVNRDAADPWWVHAFPALRHRFFRWFLVGQAISVIGSWMQNAALLWYVQIRTQHVGSEYWLGVTAAVGSLPIVLLAPLGGLIADRTSRRGLILATQVAAMVVAFLFGLMIWVDRVPFWSILAFGIVNGVILAFDIPARQAFAVEMVGREDLMSGIALNSAVFNVGRLLGPLAAGATIALVDMGSCFVLNALSFLGVIAVLVRMTPANELRVGPRTGGVHELWAGFHLVLGDRRMLTLLGALALTLLTGGTYVTLLPAFAQKYLGLDETGYSILLGANGLGSLVGALAVVGMRSVAARRPATVLGILSMSGGLISLAYAGGLWTASAHLVVVGAGFLLFLASTNSTVQLSVPDHVRGRVMSLWVLVFGLAQPIGNYIAGKVADRLGTPTMFLYAGLGCLLAAGLALLVGPEEKPGGQVASPDAQISGTAIDQGISRSGI